MTRLWPSCWAVPLALLSLAMANVTGPLCPPAHAQQYAPSHGKSWTDSITSPFKQSFEKLGRALDPKPAARSYGPEDDAISLKTKAKLGPELYVAVARLYEQGGKMAEAEKQYQLALKLDPNDLTALLGYAHLSEWLGRPDEAIQLYERAAKAHPREAAVYNNLGMCHARQPKRLDEAVEALGRAVQLEPRNPLYRNNIATVLVDQDKLRDAYGHLRAVHDPAAAYYNMGYILNKKGQTQAAVQHFNLALKTDPAMDTARRWIDHLQRPTTQGRLSQHPMALGWKVTSDERGPSASRDHARPAASRNGVATALAPSPQDKAPEPPDGFAPRRLPPTSLDPSKSDGSRLPGISYAPPTVPSAPMPPPSTHSAVRKLPQVN